MTLFLIIVAAWIGYSVGIGIAAAVFDVWGGDQANGNLLRTVLWPISLPAEFGARTLPAAPGIGRVAGLVAAASLVAWMAASWPQPRQRGPRPHPAASARAVRPVLDESAAEEAAVVGPEVERAAYQAGLMNAAAKALTDPRDCLATPGELRSYRAGCLSFVESVRHRPKTT